MKTRLDTLLVESGLVESRQKAQALILAGKVRVAGQRVDKPGHSVESNVALEVEEPLPYVSRAGLKLQAALDHFAIDVARKVCLDVGTSTGGFVDCLLQRGAARVHAVDTGAGQIHWKLRTDNRVVLHEKMNARTLRPEDIGEPIDFLACDVSFISVTLILPAALPLLKEEGGAVILVKPQFEASRADVGKGGIVRDPVVWQAACSRVAEAMVSAGFQARTIESPITGAEGNREFLLYGSRYPLP